MPGDPDYFYTLQEICVLLNLLPNTFRQIAREYPDIIQVHKQVRKGRTLLGLPAEEFEVFRAIVEMRGEGSTPEEIREAVRRHKLNCSRGPAMGAGPCEPAQADGPSSEADPGTAGETTDLNGPEGGEEVGLEGATEAAAGSDASPPDAAGVSEAGSAGGIELSGAARDAEKALATEIADLKEQLRTMEKR